MHLPFFYQFIPIDTFEGQSSSGHVVSVMPGGQCVPVHFHNRSEYVDCVLQYRLHEWDKQVLTQIKFYTFYFLKFHLSALICCHHACFTSMQILIALSTLYSSFKFVFLCFCLKACRLQTFKLNQELKYIFVRFVRGLSSLC